MSLKLTPEQKTRLVHIVGEFIDGVLAEALGQHVNGVNGSPSGTSPSLPTSSVSLGGFSSFWRLYPKRVGKGEALKAWKKNRCEKITESILLALENQLAWLTRENGKYIPNPATWLNQKRWEDEPPAPATALMSDKNAQAAKEFLGGR
jgi:hypothetical protein